MVSEGQLVEYHMFPWYYYYPRAWTIWIENHIKNRLEQLQILDQFPDMVLTEEQGIFKTTSKFNSNKRYIFQFF